MKVRIDKADKVFSEYVRLRDGRCVRCLAIGSGDKGIVGLQCSHYFGRANENTRFDPRNADALCFGCHQEWGSKNREDYRDFKINQLGEKEFEALKVQARIIKKRDRNMSYIESKLLLDSLRETI